MPLEHAELKRLSITPRLDPKSKADNGQFLSPMASARLLASFFPQPEGDIRLLDAGAGLGALTAAFVERILEKPTEVKSCVLVCYEPEPAFQDELGRLLKMCASELQERKIDARFELRPVDFIEATVGQLAAGDLFSRPKELFTHAIQNPPYKKIHSASRERQLLMSANIDTGNLYSAFLWIALEMMEEGGQLAAITPRSFCNGPYFRRFRQHLLASADLNRLHVYERRAAAFKDDEVLQENLLFLVTKCEPSRPVVTVTYSSGREDDDAVGQREVAYSKVVDPKNEESFIQLPTDGASDAIATQMQALGYSLEELGLKISTGPVVDFRLRASLHEALLPGDVPLIYPASCGKDRKVQWPPARKRKPISIAVNAETKSWLTAQGCYVLVKRFSAKEEKRRVVATLHDPADSGTGEFSQIGIENHLNFFHSPGLKIEMATGLAGFLNSSIFDHYFRQLSGHTQVNATDLRRMRYPSKEILVAIGQKAKQLLADQAALDKIVDNCLGFNAGTQHAFSSMSKIDDALSILKLVRAPAAQINERSALTLLALADLRPDLPWSEAASPLRGITPMMDWFRDNYGKQYAPNTRETIRRQTMHQFVQMGLAVENPDKPGRPINSPKWCYQLHPATAHLLSVYGTPRWEPQLKEYLETMQNALRPARRHLEMLEVTLPDGQPIVLSAGGQNELMKAIVELFCPRFAPGKVLYLGDAGAKFVVSADDEFKVMGLNLDPHGKMPDVVVHRQDKDWLLLIEAVTSHGPVDLKRRNELKALFGPSRKGLVFVTAFPDRKTMLKHLAQISWETEVWIASDPDHMIHFNGDRFLGPYEN